MISTVLFLTLAAHQPAVPGVVEALQEHQVVALGESHGIEEVHRFYLELIADPEFRKTVDDIVLEEANALHQDLLDRYVLSDDDVDIREVRRVWRDATNSLLQGGESPHYERLLNAIRRANRELPVDERIRVLAGDPPIDWNEVTEPADFWPWLGRRDRHYAEVVQTQIQNRGRTGLLIMGREHLTHTRTRPDQNNVVTLLEEAENRVFVVHLIRPMTLPMKRASSDWEVPSLIRLADSDLAGTDAQFGKPRDGKARLGETIDALLFLGDPDHFEKPETIPYSDPEFLTELARRRAALDP